MSGTDIPHWPATTVTMLHTPYTPIPQSTTLSTDSGCGSSATRRKLSSKPPLTKHNLTKSNSFEYWQAGSTKSTVGFPAPLYNVEYWRRQCPLYFPEVNGHQVGMVKGVRAEDVNKRTGGWDNVNTTRLLWVNGEYDPWRSASVASDFRPGGPFVGDEDRPAYVIPKAAHCNDMIVKNAAVNAGVKKVVDAEVKKMKQWVDEFYKKKP